MTLLVVKRIRKFADCTLGELYLNGKFFCHTLEPKDRNLNSRMSPEEIEKIKVMGKTAIPFGEYPVSLTFSGRFKRILPILHNVKGFSGIRIHSGNYPTDTLGCILLGNYNGDTPCKIVNSRMNLKNLLSQIQINMQKDSRIKIMITQDYKQD